MRKTAFLIVLLMGVGLSAVTFEQAGDKAAQYQEIGETINIRPQGLTYSGTTSYWVMELVGAYGAINVMVPVNSQTGNVEVSDSMKVVLKTHYLANYFATQEGKDDSISKFLSNTLAYAQSKKDRFKSAIADLTFYEVQVPSNISLGKLGPLKTSLSSAQGKNDAFRSQIQDAQKMVSQTTWHTTQVDATKTSLGSVFTKEDAFLNSLDDVAAHANAFLTELAGNTELLATKPNLVQAFQGIISANGLADGASSTTRDALTSSRNAINAFFAGLDLTSQEYLAKLKNRFDAYVSQEDLDALKTALENYQANYTYIVNNADSMPPVYDDDLTELHDLIEEATNYYNKDNYTAAQANFGDIDKLVEGLISHIGECPPKCTNGKVAKSDCTCACPTGTKESAGKCVSTGYSLDFTLIGGLILIIALLIVFKYKDKIFAGGGKIEEKPKDAWSNYKF